MNTLQAAQRALKNKPRPRTEEEKVRIAFQEGALAGSLIRKDKKIASVMYGLLVEMGVRSGPFDFKQLRENLMKEIRSEMY